MATETTNLKLSKADSSDAIIQTLYANNNNLDIIDENISNLKTESDTKATKAELAVLTEEISGKADISYVDSKEFTLPVATADTLGGIKVGANLAIDEDGTLRAIASSSGDSGDMLKSVYDTNGDGIVDKADNGIIILEASEDNVIDFDALTEVGYYLIKNCTTSTVINIDNSIPYLGLSENPASILMFATQTSSGIQQRFYSFNTGGLAIYRFYTLSLNSWSGFTTTVQASRVAAGTFAGQVVANATAVQTLGTAQIRNIRATTTDLTAGSSSLTTGEIVFVYE